jgi:probable F420-dependent oxidoreductase
MELGRFGVWISPRGLGGQNGAAAAALAQELGFGAIWLGGSPRLPALRPLLAATDRLTVATGIVNVWQYEPGQLAAEYAELSGEFPGRLLLGIGIGHPEATSDYTRPLSKMRAFLDGLDAASTPVGVERRCLAALGPKMLDLSAARSLGTHPYFVPVEHTRAARGRVGPAALVAPELACVLVGDSDGSSERARAAARAYATLYLGLRNYTRNLLDFGFTQDDLAGGGSDRLIDAVVPQGSAAGIAAVVREHLAAGADHVCLQTIGVNGLPRAQWTALADALLH